MNDNTCPHCNSQDHRVLTDQLGSVGWCNQCHRSWVLALPQALAPRCQQRPQQPERQRRVA